MHEKSDVNDNECYIKKASPFQEIFRNEREIEREREWEIERERERKDEKQVKKKWK